MKPTYLFMIFFACFFSLELTTPASAADKKPKLVLQITVDALRGDLPTRYRNVLGKGGFRYLQLVAGAHGYLNKS